MVKQSPKMQFKAGTSWVYRVMRMVTFFCTQFFYRRNYYKGIKNVPKNAGIIFAPNHQSAFMDAIVASQMLKTQNRYLVRADIFKNPKAAKALTSFNLLPIYRIRDGVDSMDKNDEIFATSEDALLRKETMILFPEGNQADHWQLRSLKKGYARIGFGTLKKADKDFPLFIVPVGINYYQFTDYRSELVVEYGKPIDLRNYKNLVETSEAKAINELRDELSSEMSRLMFDIQDEKNYDDIKAVSHLLTPLNDSLSKDFETRKKFFNTCGDDLEQSNLKDNIQKINQLLKDKKIEADELRLAKNGKVFIGFVPFLFLFSMISKLINAPILLPIENFITKKVKDHHFHASLRFLMSMFLYPIYYLLVFLILVLIFNWIIASTSILAFAIISWIGILASDKLRFYHLRQKIKQSVTDFGNFTQNIDKEVSEILSKL
jgi:1-acyl-sn-glycerol-3-phosphate acyltransferase